jgi:hypothetical protein
VDCPRPENPLSLRLAELGGCWLEVSGCCQIVYMPLPLLAKRRGGGLMLRDVLARLRCSNCGKKPTVMALVERTEPSSDSWRIPLDEGLDN